jgi:hypothetical protein
MSAQDKATPGYNRRMAFAFATDKRGRPIAYYWSCTGRWIRARYNDAQLFVAQGLADEIPYSK